jgi:hypothetical protein
MHVFFPSFFNTLTKDDITSLYKHEDWIVDIFGGFWEIVLKTFEEMKMGKIPPETDMGTSPS